MMEFLQKYLRQLEKEKLPTALSNSGEDRIRRRVRAFYGLLCDMYGADKLVLKASKLRALELLRSKQVAEQVLGLQRLLDEDPTVDEVPAFEALDEIMDRLEEQVADYLARRSVEEELERKVTARMQEKHEEYVHEIRLQIVKEESVSYENAQTLKKLAMLEKMDQVSLARTAMEVLRPGRLDELVGQEEALQSLIAKLSSPYPQHILVYGPPGVGKTSAARLALQTAKGNGRSSFVANAPFIELNGATLRWDPREITNPLLGSVHDPIYQGARRDLAENGVPEPKPGLVTEAHGGVLFIDEIGEMDPILLTKLLKVLEDKRVRFDSPYFDPHDDKVPQYIKKLFQEGAPADFILIGATTRGPEEINPALRSRCVEVFFEPLTPAEIQEIARRAAVKLGMAMEAGVPELISRVTIDGRQANNLLADAFGLALVRQGDQQVVITGEILQEVTSRARLTSLVMAKTTREPQVGRVLGLAVAGFIGSVLEIEAVAFPARQPGKGQLRFNETAGRMARDSVFNAASVFRGLTGRELGEYDVHVNVVGGGNIDGPSAGLAILLAIVSAVEKKPLRQDVAITGEISVRGMVKPVGGIREKLYGARQAGVKTVLLPADNLEAVPPGLTGINVVPVRTVEEALVKILADGMVENAS